MQAIWAKQALTGQGWKEKALVTIGDTGEIVEVRPDASPEGERVDVLLPSPANLHCHAFQRAMAGMCEKRGDDSEDDFWSWRRLMFLFLDQLTPSDIHAIAAFVQMEMLEAGYSSVGEFHYVHHQPDGTRYDDLAELCGSIIEAAAETGIGLTLIPILYQHGGCDARPLAQGQVRFGNSPDQFLRLWEEARAKLDRLPADSNMGVGAHSLRAVTKGALGLLRKSLPDVPFHLHLAEQAKEVEEVKEAWGARPIEWVLENTDVNKQWCLVHSTQATEQETDALAKTGAVAGLCPITESNLGDGIFRGRRFMEAGGKIGVGSDSNVRIALAEELRTLEYSQRLQERKRAVLAKGGMSVGRTLFDLVCAGGAQALGRNAGAIEPGMLADMVALDTSAVFFDGSEHDEILDSWIFASDDSMVRHVWSAGRHMVKEGTHVHRERIAERYASTLASLRGRFH